MQIDLSKLDVKHNPDENRFETWIDGNLSKLDYIQDGKNFVITHVGVHPSLRGQGVAGRIVEASLAYARKNSLRVTPGAGADLRETSSLSSKRSPTTCSCGRGTTSFSTFS